MLPWILFGVAVEALVALWWLDRLSLLRRLELLRLEVEARALGENIARTMYTELYGEFERYKRENPAVPKHQAKREGLA